MKKFGKLKLIGFVFILTGALIFIGINFLDAQVQITKGPKKPKPPKEEATWQVVIPGEASASELQYNLFGLTPFESQDQNIAGFIYEDKGEGDGFGVEVKKIGRGKRAESQFRLAVFNNIDEESGVCNPVWPDGFRDRKIGFRNIGVTDVWFADTAAFEYPCFFPSLTYPPYPKEVPDHGYGDAPDCLADFLNNYLHPYCDPDPTRGHPEYSYEYVDIIITVNCNFEDLVPGVPYEPSGDVQVRVVNTFDLQSGYDYPHNISSHLSEGNIQIKKLDNADVDAWEITVDALITFTEIYKGTLRNRWEYKIPYWAQIPLTFKTTWIRKEVTDS